MSDGTLIELAQLAEELCQPHRHTERVYDTTAHRNRRLRRVYVSTQDGLLRQLRDAAEGLRVGDTGPMSGKPESRPPGAFEALARHVHIADSAQQWCRRHRVNPRGSVEADILALVGTASVMDPGDRAALLREVRHWHGQAAAATGWISPPYTPPVPCPSCARVGSIRVVLATRAAYCTNSDRDDDGALVCGSIWEPGSVTEDSALVKYIRVVTDGSSAA